MTNVDDSLSQRVHQLLRLAPGKSRQEVKVHFESLIRLESEERRESALLILETMTSECGHIIGLIAGDLLLQFGKPEDIPQLENAIHRLPQIDGLIDWRKRIGSTDSRESEGLNIPPRLHGFMRDALCSRFNRSGGEDQGSVPTLSPLFSSISDQNYSGWDVQTL